MIKPIVMYPNELLSQRSSAIRLDDPELPALIEDLTDTVKEADGVGLSAVQIGVLKRVFVTHIGGNIAVYINPKIIARGIEKETLPEGCLSLPGKMVQTRRHRRIKVMSDTQVGPKVREAKDFIARVIAHESEHLDGEMIFGKVP